MSEVRYARIAPRFHDLAVLAAREDEHPDIRLQLLAEVTLAVDDRVATSRETRVSLADRIERWRYQFINHRSGHLTPDQLDMTRQLDLLSNELRDAPVRPPRSLRDAILAAGSTDLGPEVERAFDPGSPLADLEQAALDTTLSHFQQTGQTSRSMVLYAPLYLSNHCINHCLYCGFRYPNEMERQQLDLDQALAEAAVLERHGFRHLLIVAGEFPRFITLDYLTQITAALHQRGLSIAIEVAPQSTLGYTQLRAAGATGVTLYQEVYDQPLYAHYHPKGTKAWYDGRLEGPERAAEAGINRLGLGILLGLADPHAEIRALIAHGRYLAARFPHLQLAFSLPRIREAPEGFQAAHPVDETGLIRLYCALRLAFPTSHLVLSTRESPALRDHLARICITQMSAGSSTSPGGYQEADAAASCQRQQFPVFDHRSPAEVAAWLDQAGLSVQWDHH